MDYKQSTNNIKFHFTISYSKSIDSYIKDDDNRVFSHLEKDKKDKTTEKKSHTLFIKANMEFVNGVFKDTKINTNIIINFIDKISLARRRPTLFHISDDGKLSSGIYSKYPEIYSSFRSNMEDLIYVFGATILDYEPNEFVYECLSRDNEKYLEDINKWFENISTEMYDVCILDNFPEIPDFVSGC